MEKNSRNIYRAHSKKNTALYVPWVSLFLSVGAIRTKTFAMLFFLVGSRMRNLMFLIALFLSDTGLTKADIKAPKNILEKALFFKLYPKPNFLKPEPKTVLSKTGEEILGALLLLSSSAPKPKTEYLNPKNQMLEEWNQRHKKIAGVDR